MSRRKNKAFKRPQNEIDSFRTAPAHSTIARRIENWILYGDKDGKEAVQELFPVKRGTSPLLP
jgi:hypothetical protein